MPRLWPSLLCRFPCHSLVCPEGFFSPWPGGGDNACLPCPKVNHAYVLWLRTHVGFCPVQVGVKCKDRVFEAAPNYWVKVSKPEDGGIQAFSWQVPLCSPRWLSACFSVFAALKASAAAAACSPRVRPLPATPALKKSVPPTVPAQTPTR